MSGLDLFVQLATRSINGSGYGWMQIAITNTLPCNKSLVFYLNGQVFPMCPNDKSISSGYDWMRMTMQIHFLFFSNASSWSTYALKYSIPVITYLSVKRQVT